MIDITKAAAEYMRQMEAAPFLKANGLSGEFKLLADFNGSVLAGQETSHGVQMVTWDWAYNKTGVTHSPCNTSNTYFALNCGLYVVRAMVCFPFLCFRLFYHVHNLFVSRGLNYGDHYKSIRTVSRG